MASNSSIYYLFTMSLVLLSACDNQEKATAIEGQLRNVAVGIEALGHAVSIKPGPISRGILVAAVYDLPLVAVADEPKTGAVHTPPGPHLRYKTFDDITIHVKAEAGGVLLFELHNIDKGLCRLFGKMNPIRRDDLIYNKDHSLYFMSVGGAACTDPDPTVSLRYCVPKLGACPTPTT